METFVAFEFSEKRIRECLLRKLKTCIIRGRVKNMIRIKRMIATVLFLIIIILSFPFSAIAGDIENEKKYKPLDLVVVLDSSGSMLDSDKDRTALAAVRMLVNMMPAEDSKVGVVGFNRTANVLTKDVNGNNALLSLDSLTNIATIRKNVSDVVYNGGTGIGNAVFKATELLKSSSSAERAKSIILFTDGINDFGNDAIALSNCEENEASALLWAKKNNCPIYCVGYDYIKSDGISSMGKNGEGLKKLNNISTATQGKFKSINSIDEIEQLLIEFLADVCDLNYTTVATIPGDGGKHECKIPISPSVVEANIRIAGGDDNSIAKGKIQLFDPNGNEVELKNAKNVRFDTDATAASIKVTMPKTGEWLLVVEGVKGDDIHVGLLEHFKMNLTSTISLPKGNPEGVAYSNDEVGIKTWLTYDGQNLNDEAIYAAVKSATAVCIPRANPDNKKIIQLHREGLSFVGSFVIPQDCFYDITIRLDWDTVYREDTLEIQSSNKPLFIKRELPDVKVNKNKTVTLTDIYQYVDDDEKDKITASISSISSPGVADVNIVGDDLILTGKKMSSSLVTIAFTDAQGNTVETTLKVKVNDPVVWITLILLVLLGIAIAIVVPYVSYLKSLKIRGKLYLTQIDFCESNDDYYDEPDLFDFTNEDGYEGIEAYEDALYIPMDRFYRKKKKRTVYGLISETLDLFRGCELDTAQYNAKAALIGNTAKELMVGVEKSKIVGVPNGSSFTIKINKKTPNLTINKSSKGAKISNGKKMELCFKIKHDASSSKSKSYIKLHYYFVSPVRERKSRNK